MRILTAAFLALSVTNLSAGTEIDPLISRIEERINATTEQVTRPEAKAIKVDVPLDLAFQRESQLWTSITAAYDHLRSYDLQARHRFLYFASKVNARPRHERLEELRKWLKEETYLIQSLGMPTYFYTEWKKKTAAINEAIHGLESPYPALEVRPQIIEVVADDKQFLGEIRDEIQTMASATSRAETTAANNTDVSLEVGNVTVNKFFDLGNLQYILYFGALFVAFLIGFTVRKSKDEDLRKLNEKNKSASSAPEKIPEIPLEAMSQVPSNSQAIYFDQGVNLEEECRKIIDQNSHLLQVAQLNVVPTARSPFKSSVDAPADKVAEALSWLLKGTIAIANSNNGKATHLEWQCREQHGRVSLEFVLHGMECDIKALYLNTLIEGDGSAPAHFGRSEMALAEHLASVGFKSGNRKTTVSLGLDTLASPLNH